MKIDAKGKYGSSLRLGIQSTPENFEKDCILKAKIQSTPENFEKDCILKAKYWAPKKAKSFTIDKVYNYGPIQEKVTGEALIIVSYYSTEKEGKHSLISRVDNSNVKNNTNNDDDKVIEMNICEYEHLVLRANRLYRFRIDPNCEKCKRMNVY